MSGNFKKKDLRISKTYKSLEKSMLLLLSKHNFMKITVNDICEDALISRATFYTHFYDKYDFLRYILSQSKNNILILINNCPKDKIIDVLNEDLSKNIKIISNLIENHSHESINIIIDCIIQILKLHFKSNEDNQDLYRFCAGGIITILKSKIENKTNTQIFDEKTYLIIKNIIETNKLE